MCKKLLILAAICALSIIATQISLTADEPNPNHAVDKGTNIINVASDLVEDEGGISHLPNVRD